MLVSELYPRTWLHPDDLAGHIVTVTIDHVEPEQVYNPRTREDVTKLCVYFAGKQKHVICNKTQARALADMISDNTDNWTGHRVQLSVGRAPNGQPTIVITPPPPSPAEPEHDEAEEEAAAAELAAAAHESPLA